MLLYENCKYIIQWRFSVLTQYMMQVLRTIQEEIKLEDSTLGKEVSYFKREEKTVLAEGMRKDCFSHIHVDILVSYVT